MSNPHPTYALISLGCPKNLVDSERMAGLLQRDGYQMVRRARRRRGGGRQHLRVHSAMRGPNRTTPSKRCCG